MANILLGLYDGYMSQQLDALTSETKLGGRPTYFPRLSPAQQASVSAWTTCGVCGHAMYLLLQAYSPLPSAPSSAAHHRMMYVFACNSASCARQPSSSWAAFSLQVNRDDDAEDPEESDGEDLTQDGTQPLPLSVLPPHCFPPCHVFIEPEPAKATFVPTALEKELIAKAEKRLREEPGEGDLTDKDIKELEATVDLKDKRSDYLYEKFRERVARAPSQVLRYHQRGPPTTSPDAGADTEAQAQHRRALRPIFMNPDKVRQFVRVPACATCGAALVHELQVMPTSLYYLRVAECASQARSGTAQSRPVKGQPDSTAASSPSSSSATGAAPSAAGAADVDEGVDFATATVYVCSRDCAMSAMDSTASTLVHRAPVRGAQGDAAGQAIPDEPEEVVVLRREFVCVESPPTLQEEKQEKKLEDRARAGGVVRKDFREMLEAAGSEEEDEEADTDEANKVEQPPSPHTDESTTT